MTWVYDHASRASDIQVGWQVNLPFAWDRVIVEWVRVHGTKAFISGVSAQTGEPIQLTLKAKDGIVAHYRTEEREYEEAVHNEGRS